MALLLQEGWNRGMVVAICPLFFGLAHLHHLWDLAVVRQLPRRVALARVGLQMAYTTMFGAFATALLLQTGSLAAPAAAHIFCNAMGLPPLAAVAAYSHTSRLALTLGICGFATGLRKLWLQPAALLGCA